MPNNVFGRVELLLNVVKIAIPVFVVMFLIVFGFVIAFAVKYRRALKHKILSLPVRTVRPGDDRRRRTSDAEQQTHY